MLYHLYAKLGAPVNVSEPQTIHTVGLTSEELAILERMVTNAATKLSYKVHMTEGEFKRLTLLKSIDRKLQEAV